MKFNRRLPAFLLAAMLALGAHAKTVDQSWTDFSAEAINLAKKQSPENTYRFNQAVEFVNSALRTKRYGDIEPYLGFFQQQSTTSTDAYKRALEAFTAALRAAKEGEAAAREAAINKIAADFTTKFKANAPASEYDALLLSLGPLAADENALQRQGYQGAGVKAAMLQRFVSRWQDYLVATTTNNPERAQQALRELSELNSSGTVQLLPRSEILAVLSEAQKLTTTANADKQTALAHRLDDLLSGLPTLLDTAKQPADLDSAIADVTKLEMEVNQIPYESRRVDAAGFSRITAAKRLLSRWQDRLVALAAGNTPKALEIGTELANSNESVATIYPRSKLLSLPSPAPNQVRSTMPTVDDVIDLIPDSLEGLADANFALAARRQSRRGFSPTNTESYLNQLVQGYTQLLAGDPSFALRLVNTTAPYTELPANANAKLAALRQTLINRAIQVYFNLPKDFKPSTGSNPAAVLSEAINYARSKADWVLVLRLVDYWRLNFDAMRNDNTTLGDESLVLRYYLAAINQENAGQYRMAVLFYTRSLLQPSRYLPVEDVGRRLNNLKAQHPKEYQDAMKSTDSPPLLNNWQQPSQGPNLDRFL